MNLFPLESAPQISAFIPPTFSKAPNPRFSVSDLLWQKVDTDPLTETVLRLKDPFSVQTKKIGSVKTCQISGRLGLTVKVGGLHLTHITPACNGRTIPFDQARNGSRLDALWREGLARDSSATAETLDTKPPTPDGGLARD